MSELCSAGILGTGHYAPEKILSNADLERMVDTSDEWIRTRTGIETRHIASRSETTSDLCVKAALPALEMAGLTPDDIDYIIVATASPDYVVPSTACMVQDKLGCKHAGAMDISAGCSGIESGESRDVQAHPDRRCGNPFPPRELAGPLDLHPFR